MHFDISLIKKHKVATVVIVGIGAIVLYLLLKGSSGSSGASSATGLTTTDLQAAQLTAAENVQQSQIQSTQNIAQINADVQNNQTAASLALGQAQIQASTVQQANQIAGNLSAINLEGTISTQQQVNAEQTQLAETQLGTSAAVDVAGIQAGAYETAVNAQTAVESQALSNQAAIDTSVIQQAGKDTGRSSTGWTQIISSLFGQGPAAIAANQPSQVAGSPSAIISATGGAAGGILKGVGGIISSLFG